MAKYLHITFHDNDFYDELEYVSNNLYEMFQMEGRYPDNEDLKALEYIIPRMTYSFYLAGELMRWKDTNPHLKDEKHYLDYFVPHMEFVEFWEIPDWDNHESFYIPMFDDAKIIMR